MFKPLLRVLPSLNGNVKIACDLMDYYKITNKRDAETYVTNIRGAKLVPLSSDKFQYSFNINLLNSTYEYDIKKFYNYYKDIFYSTCYTFLKDDIKKLDLTTSNTNIRNIDFEYGCKRISYSKNKQEYAFFAPIYCESYQDIPDYFLINIEFKYNARGKILYKVNKKIKVNINDTGTKGIYKSKNYIKDYLNDYYSKIDSHVGYCIPSTNQTSFYGIDVKNGGFTKIVDNKSGIIYSKHNTINNFDATLCQAFERNNIIMKQILPLCYYFNLDNILDPDEKEKYKFSEVRITGKYYKDSYPVDFYDFETDYYEYKPYVYKLNNDRTELQWTNTKNVLNVGYPSLNEAHYSKYQFSNKLSPWYCHWKLHQTSDDHPYVMNLSYAFSFVQDESSRYYTFPQRYPSKPLLVDSINEGKNKANESLYLPYLKYSDKYSGSILNVLYNNYSKLIEHYYTNWFDIVKLENNAEDTINNIMNLSSWTEVINDKSFYNGILYNFKNIYTSHEDVPHITKFNVVLAANFINVSSNSSWSNDDSLIDTSDNEYIYVDSCIHKNNGKYVKTNGITNPVYVSDKDIYDDDLNPNRLYYFDVDNTGKSKYTTEDDYEVNLVFKKLNQDEIEKYNKDKENYSPSYGMYVDISADFYELNKWYLWDNVSIYINSIIDSIENTLTRSEYENKLNDLKNTTTEAYCQVSIYRRDLLDFGDTENNNTYKNDFIRSLKDNGYLIYDTYQSQNKYVNCTTEYLDNSINEKYLYMIYKKGTYVPASLFVDFINDVKINTHTSSITVDGEIINLDDIKEIIETKYSYYTYYPIYKKENTVYGENVMIRHNEYYGDFYGCHIKESNYTSGSLLQELNDKQQEAIRSSADIEKLKQLAFEYSTKQLTNDNQGILLVDSYNMDNLLKNIPNDETIIDPVFKYNINDNLSNYTKSPNFDDKSIWGVENDTSTDSGSIDQGEIDLQDIKGSNKAISDDGKINTNNIDESSFINNINDISNAIKESILNDSTYNNSSSVSGINSTISIKNDGNIIGKIDFDNNSMMNNYITELFAKDLTIYTNKETNVKTKSLSDLRQFYLSSGYATESEVDNIIKTTGESYLNNTLVTQQIINQLSNKITAFGKFCNLEHLYLYCVKLGNDEKQYGWNKVYKLQRYVTFIDGKLELRDIYTPWLENGAQYEEFWEAYKKLQNDNDNLYKLSNLVYLGEFYQVNEQIFEYIMQRKVDDKSTGYTDLYLYYIDPRENYTNTILYSSDSKNTSITRRSLNGNDNIKDYDISNINTLDYDGQSTTINNVAQQIYVYNIGNVAKPLFNGVYKQDKANTVLYKEASLNKIQRVTIKNDSDQTYYRYRYNMNDSVMLIEDNDTETYPVQDDYGFYNRYELFDTANITINPFDSVTTFKDYKLSVYDNLYILEPNETCTDTNVYGFYCMSTSVNNTFNYLNIVDKDYQQVKSVKFINDTNIITDSESTQQYVLSILKSLLTCANVNLFKLLYNINTLILPNIYSFDSVYKSYTGKNGNIEILSNNDYINKVSLMRYFDDITPLLTKRSTYDNLFMLKYKKVDAGILDTGKYNETDDTPIYHSKCNIYDYPGILIQNDIKGNYETTPVYPFEYKYYNDNHLIYLEKEFEIELDGTFTYNELLENQDKAYDEFCNYINKYIYVTTDDIDKQKSNQIRNLFLFNKYNIKYDSKCVGLNDAMNEKIYKLIFKFELL